MYTGRTLFSQLMDFVPWTSFHRIVGKCRGDIGVRTLRCTEHFRIMAFAQITYRESLRDIEACLGAQPAKLCSMGLRDDKASVGITGSVFRLLAAFFEKETGTHFTLVPYRGGAPAIQDLIAGQIDLYFGTLVYIPQVRAGSI
jgi:hypothetical protein